MKCPSHGVAVAGKDMLRKTRKNNNSTKRSSLSSRRFRRRPLSMCRQSACAGQCRAKFCCCLHGCSTRVSEVAKLRKSVDSKAVGTPFLKVKFVLGLNGR